MTRHIENDWDALKVKDYNEGNVVSGVRARDGYHPGFLFFEVFLGGTGLLMAWLVQWFVGDIIFGQDWNYWHVLIVMLLISNAHHRTAHFFAERGIWRAER